ncbi:MAG: neutral/alkaline non-lysosomal ceramidase N-terminal domain-containing protein [Opitutaceae bacterium]|nr:neutral/alkaline non-lysosomal ceramidase N-terminal domain-containing protein [Opitutaceae bacterium]
MKITPTFVSFFHPRLLVLGWLAAAGAVAAIAAETRDARMWKAGAAAIDITPEGPIWMAGYGARKKPSEGVSQKLFAKALALEDAWGTPMVMVTLDLISVPRRVRDEVERQSRERYQLRPESLLLNASHTHSGPAPYARGVGDPAYVEKAESYGRMLEQKIVEVIGQAIARLEPATLHYTHARAGFAMNRRLRVGTEIRNSPNPEGPVDHDVPVLRVTGADKKVRAILFGYACHNTVTGFYTINADYAGYAQAFLEETRPGTVALFMMGAGGDQNPYPRHLSLEQSAQHGRTLANAVEAALSVTTPRPVLGPLRSAFGHAELDYADISRADLERRAQSRAADEKKRAGELLAQLEKGTLPKSYPCPVQVVQFGTDVTLIAIGGETTVDYSLRLKHELGSGPAAIWVAGYSNDVFGYLGSRRVIVEGGYEGYSANLGRHPGPWATSSEDRIISLVYELSRSINH